MSNKISSLQSSAEESYVPEEYNFPHNCQYSIAHAIEELFKVPEIGDSIQYEHIKDTPKRVAKAMLECFEGCFKDPASVLSSLFPSEGSEMIHVGDVRFISYCAHHMMPFAGKYTFAYIPDKHIVGLSKIPRMVQIFTARPQVQEKLANDIVTTFQNIVKPRGCAVTIDAEHYCMCARGVKEYGTTRTTAITGIFTSSDVKSEYLASIGPFKGAR